MTFRDTSGNAGSASSLDQRLLELSALFEICQTLTSSFTLGAVLENVLRIPMGHFIISKGVVLLKNPRSSGYSVDGVKGLPRELLHKTLRIPDPPGHPMLADDFPGQEEWAAFFREFGIRIALPLTAPRGFVGLLGFGDRIGDRPYGEKEVEFLNSVSGIAATSLANGLMVSEIQEINQQLDRKVQQLNTVFDIGRELNTTIDRRTVGSILSFAVMGELMLHRCAVLLGDGGCVKLLVAKGLAATPAPDPALLHLAEPERLEEGKRFADLHRAGLALLVPMRIHDETRGVLAVGPKLSGAPFSDTDLEFLTTLGNQAMTSLENVRLFEEALEKQRMEEELRFAQNIQKDLLPQILPAPDGYRIAAVNIPSREIGGDYYDAIALSDTVFGIAIADVSGKGAGAALLMANLQASLRALAHREFPVKDMVARINNLIFQNTALDKFITFFYGELDTARNTFTYCNAGHNPPIRIGTSGIPQELEKGGLILGMMANVPFVTETVELHPGDRILLYTDGISEAVNESGAEYGLNRVVELLQQNPGWSADEMIESILGDVKRFRGNAGQNDDMTMVAVKVLR
jgi:sigma-B regulation protein RsbU (phosphoserine phosphatase)